MSFETTPPSENPESYEHHEPAASGQGSGERPFTSSEGHAEETFLTPGGPPPEVPDWASVSPEPTDTASDRPPKEQGSISEPPALARAVYEGYTYPVLPTLPDGSTAGEVTTNPTIGTPVFQDVDPTLMPDIVAQEGREWPKSREHLSTLPTSEDDTTANPVIVRTFPKPIVEVPPMTVSKAEQQVAVVVEHFRFLAGTEEKPGLVIPDTYYQVQTRPDDSVYISNITTQLNGEDMDVWRAAEQPTWQPVHDPIAAITDTLGDYYEWILTTDQKLFLSDLSRPDQYMITADNRPVIADTDPQTGDLSTQEGWDDLEKAIGELVSFNNCLPESRQKEKVKAQCNRLRKRVLQAEDEIVPSLPSKWNRRPRS